MRRPRAIPVALTLIVLSTAQAQPRDEPRRVLYLDEETPAVSSVMSKLRAQWAHSRFAGQRMDLQLVPVDLSSLDAIEAAVRKELPRRPAAILASNSNAAIAARRATAEVPIVFASHQDPIRVGLARSLARPGGNATGFTYFVPVDGKRLELLREIAPRLHRLGVVADRWWLEESGGGEAIDAARELGFDVHVFRGETQDELEAALATPRARSMDGWYVPYTRIAYERPDVLVHDIRALRKPAVFANTRFVEDGGLISYQQTLSVDDATRLLVAMLGQVLDGVPAGEIPIERPKSFVLAVNLDAARELGLRVPDGLIKRADRVVARNLAAARR